MSLPNDSYRQRKFYLVFLVFFNHSKMEIYTSKMILYGYRFETKINIFLTTAWMYSRTNTLTILCTRCAFRLLKFLKWCSGRKRWKGGGGGWKLKEFLDQNQTECHEIEPSPSTDRAMPEGNNPSFWVEFTKCTFLTVQFIFVF
jgi:hypothetical protein